MTVISAKIIEDSISSEGVRLTTLQLTYNRYIHGELMTHRVFSRNAMSSRAVPVAKMIEQVRNDPAMPIHWGANQPGMQAHQQLEGAALAAAKEEWLTAARQAANRAEAMQALGLHKQVANRALEPFQWMHTIVTATEWANFFELRDHPDAQPEMRELAVQVRLAMNGSVPTLLKMNEWHLPFVSAEERGNLTMSFATLCKLSAARSARVSYMTHDGKTPDLEKDLALYERLVGSKPLHASPIEHQATPDCRKHTSLLPEDWQGAGLHGNFIGWCQYRKIIEALL